MVAPNGPDTGSNNRPQTAVFWLVFGVAALAGLIVANAVDLDGHRAVWGPYGDGGLTFISLFGVPVMAAVVAVLRKFGFANGLAVAAVYGLAGPIGVIYITILIFGL